MTATAAELEQNTAPVSTPKLNENGYPEEPPAQLIFVKSHNVGEDSKGRYKLDLRFSEEETKMIIEELGKVKSRAKIQIHVGETSAFLFIKEVQERGAFFNKKPMTGGGNGYKPATGGADVKAKIASMKNKG